MNKNDFNFNELDENYNFFYKNNFIKMKYNCIIDNITFNYFYRIPIKDDNIINNELHIKLINKINKENKKNEKNEENE